MSLLRSCDYVAIFYFCFLVQIRRLCKFCDLRFFSDDAFRHHQNRHHQVAMLANSATPISPSEVSNQLLQYCDTCNIYTENKFFYRHTTNIIHMDLFQLARRKATQEKNEINKAAGGCTTSILETPETANYTPNSIDIYSDSGPHSSDGEQTLVDNGHENVHPPLEQLFSPTVSCSLDVSPSSHRTEWWLNRGDDLPFESHNDIGEVFIVALPSSEEENFARASTQLKLYVRARLVRIEDEVTFLPQSAFLFFAAINSWNFNRLPPCIM